MKHANFLQTRERLISAAKSITATLNEQAQADEDGNTLSGKTVRALEESGMFR